MSGSLRKTLVVAAAGCLISFVPAVAQQPAQPRVLQPAQPATQPNQVRPQQRTDQAARADGDQRTDHLLEQWLIIDNRAELEVARFAQQHAKSQEVQDFAKMMIQDHTDFVQALEQFHQQHAAARGRAGAPVQQPAAQQPAAQQPATQPGARPAGQDRVAGAAQRERQDGPFNVLTLKQELAQQCVKSAKEKFGKLEGQQFDMCYMGLQMAGHMKMIDTLEVFKQHASPELAEIISGGIETTKDHLMHAERILKQFGGAAAETARRPTDEKK